jgi:pyruvate/2-oxoglutarate dehydrogenase complex dihydrolipoamide acyltransferase (E2) component
METTMEEVRQDAAETTVEEGSEENGGRQDRTWFPYITKVQFERFLSRLESKIPDQIDRDYVRPIIRTPSMLHRFLRGIESMNLTDRNQKPTDRLLRLVPQETRRFAIAEVVRDLYKELLPEWEQSNGNMSDDAIVDYFRNRTGMGRDSANKMKMFFKYLIAEADFGDPSEPQEEATATEPAPQDERSETPEPAPQEDRSAREPAPQEDRSAREPAPKERSGRDGRAKRQEDRQLRTPQCPRTRAQERQQERPQQERPQQERPLTETQRAYLETLQSTVQIKIDGDWDEDMIRLVFDRLERLFDRLRRA